MFTTRGSPGAAGSSPISGGGKLRIDKAELAASFSQRQAAKVQGAGVTFLETLREQPPNAEIPARGLLCLRPQLVTDQRGVRPPARTASCSGHSAKASFAAAHYVKWQILAGSPDGSH